MSVVRSLQRYLIITASLLFSRVVRSSEYSLPYTSVLKCKQRGGKKCFHHRNPFLFCDFFVERHRRVRAESTITPPETIGNCMDAGNCADAEIRIYNNLFSDEAPDADGKDFIECLNPESLEVLHGAKVENMLREAKPTDRYQFLRMGYFCADSRDSSPEHLVFNRAVALKDGFKK